MSRSREIEENERRKGGDIQEKERTYRRRKTAERNERKIWYFIRELKFMNSYMFLKNYKIIYIFIKIFDKSYNNLL